MSPPEKLDHSENQILAALPEQDYKRMLPGLESVSFGVGETISEPGEEVRYVYFPNNCMISLLITLEGGESVEVGVVGNEGMFGVNYALGNDTSPNLAIAQTSGSCMKMRAEVFRTEFQRVGPLRDQVLGHAGRLLAMISQTVACNRIHLLEQRLARWLLLVHDRATSDQFPMTHEFISRMLGTPRSEVTKAAGALKLRGLIQYEYGKITVLDRKGLEAAACECYQTVRDIYDSSLDGGGRTRKSERVTAGRA